MTRISSSSTFLYKKGIPALWFGFVLVFIVITLVKGARGQDLIFLLGPCFMVVIGFFLFRKLVWDLADEVRDGGDFLVVRYGSEEETLPVSNIMNVSASTALNPPRITLRLVQAGKFGAEVSFSPKAGFTLNPFAKNEVAEDLMVRVDKARSGRRA